MNRIVSCLILAVVAAVAASGVMRPAALYSGKMIRLPDGSCYEVLGRDPDAQGYWQVSWIGCVGRLTPTDPPILSLDAEDLEALERGESPLETARREMAERGRQ